MKFADALWLALRNLRQAKLRTALTTLGVAIGIASLAGMVSLGVALEDQVVGGFVRSGVFDIITVTPILNRGAMGGRGFGGRRGQPPPSARGPIDQTATGADTPRATLDDAAMAKLAALEHVREVYPNLRIPVEVRYQDRSEFVSASGVPMSARDEGAFRTFVHGGFFANDSDNACLLILDMARRLSNNDPQALIGKTVTIAYAASPAPGGMPAGVPMPLPVFQVQQVEVPFTVAGIVEREPGPAMGGTPGLAGLMIPMSRAREIDARVVTSVQSILRGSTAQKGYASLIVKVTDPKFTGDVQDRIKGLGFSAFSLNDGLQNAKRAFILLDILLSLIGSIALAVSSLGIVNTMVMSILERTREIGVMKAIGGSDSDVRRIFLVEASAIGVLGGISGVILGWAVGRVINFGANWYIEGQGGPAMNLFSLPIWLIGGAIGFAILVSLLAGSYPARRAARLNPIDALRHD